MRRLLGAWGRFVLGVDSLLQQPPTFVYLLQDKTTGAVVGAHKTRRGAESQRIHQLSRSNYRLTGLRLWD